MLHFIAGLRDPDISKENIAFFLEGFRSPRRMSYLTFKTKTLRCPEHQKLQPVTHRNKTTNLSHIVTRLPTSTRDFITACTIKSTTLSYAWLVNISLKQCFPNMVPRNPMVTQNIMRGCERNSEINA
jgi:hypothetical protein